MPDRLAPDDIRRSCCHRQSAVGIIDVGGHIRAIREAWRRRELIDLGETIVTDAFRSASSHDDGTYLLVGR
jgi:hypothetical protein